jgi:hypothetical protein
MASRSRLPVQGITARLSAVTVVALVVVTGLRPARAQAPGGAQAPQPPPFTAPAEKFPGNPPADATPAPAAVPPRQDPEPPKWPGTPWDPSAPADPNTSQNQAAPAYPPPPAAYPPTSAYPPPGDGQVPSLSASQTPAASPAPVVDPQGDRVVLLPTATTHPAGTFYFSSYELVIFQAGYAFTDSTQVSLTLIPVPRESATFVDVSVKTSLYRGGLVRAAAIGSASGAGGKDIGVQLVGRAGGVVQVCIARRCESSLSLSSNVLLAGALLIMVNGAGGIWRMSEHVSVLAELATMVPLGTQGGQFNGAALGGGIRLHYAHWGFDFAAMHALDSTSDVTTIPFLAMTWRP